jgi:hypothetical protein
VFKKSHPLFFCRQERQPDVNRKISATEYETAVLYRAKAASEM